MSPNRSSPVNSAIRIRCVIIDPSYTEPHGDATTPVQISVGGQPERVTITYDQTLVDETLHDTLDPPGVLPSRYGNEITGGDRAATQCSDDVHIRALTNVWIRSHECIELGNDSIDLRLLQHRLADEDRPWVSGLAPRQPTSVLFEPDQECVLEAEIDADRNADRRRLFQVGFHTIKTIRAIKLA